MSKLWKTNDARSGARGWVHLAVGVSVREDRFAWDKGRGITKTPQRRSLAGDPEPLAAMDVPGIASRYPGPN